MDDKPPIKGAWSGSHDPFSISIPAVISGTAEARVAKFCLQVEYVCINDRLPPLGDRLHPPMGVVRVTWPVFRKFCPNYIFGVGETRHFKCRMLNDAAVYYCMNDRLPPKVMCSGSREIFTFWK